MALFTNSADSDICNVMDSILLKCHMQMNQLFSLDAMIQCLKFRPDGKALQHCRDAC